MTPSVGLPLFLRYFATNAVVNPALPVSTLKSCFCRYSISLPTDRFSSKPISGCVAMSSASASSSLSISSFARATTWSRSALGAVSFATIAGTSSDCSSAAIFFRTSRAASRSVGVSCAFDGMGKESAAMRKRVAIE